MNATPMFLSSSSMAFATSTRSNTNSNTNENNRSRTTTTMMKPSPTQQQRNKNRASVAALTTRNEDRMITNTTRQLKNKRGSALQTSAALPDALHSAATLSEISALEGNIQGFYLGTLLLILGFSGFIVVRQVFIRRELDDQAKKTGERIRAGNASSDDYFEMGSIMLRKKVYTQAIRNLQLAAENWEGDEEDLAQVHNALGFGYAEMDKYEDAIKEFKLASQLQPGYVTVWNNLGDAYEKLKMQKEAVKCYEEALVLAPGNSVATMRLKNMRERAERLGLTIE
jgi:tetratricopeptide (TPR) repeat protein